MPPPELPAKFSKPRKVPLWRKPSWWRRRLKDTFVPVLSALYLLLLIAQQAWALLK